jgi:hypothetical protein
MINDTALFLFDKSIGIESKVNHNVTEYAFVAFYKDSIFHDHSALNTKFEKFLIDPSYSEKEYSVPNKYSCKKKKTCWIISRVYIFKGFRCIYTKLPRFPKSGGTEVLFVFDVNGRLQKKIISGYIH